MECPGTKRSAVGRNIKSGLKFDRTASISTGSRIRSGKD